MRIILLASTILLVSCATAIPDKQVTLVNSNGEFHQGKLTYDGPYSGNLVFESGPEGESFSGRYTVIDKTSVKKSSGDLIVPNGGPIPAIGSTASSESGEIKADGYYFAKSKTGSLKCEIVVGAQGHGKGRCTHSDGSTYDIIL